MFFSKSISDLTFEDVSNFALQGIKEGINIDYKRDFTADIEKTISAFANTHGGVVIIGIDDQDGKPKIPVTGIDYVEGLHERVVQKCVEAIYPPVFPEIKVCEPVSNKTFIVIQVPESDQTPHAVTNRTKVYYRTDNITLLEDRANVDRIQWLLNRREKSVDLRKAIIQDANKHFHDIWLYDTHNTTDNTVAILAVKVPPCITFSLVPVFPSKALTSPQKISDEIDGWRKTNKRDYSFPRYTDTRCMPVQGGIRLFKYIKETGYFFYEEINEFGLLFSKEDLIHTVGENDQHWQPGSYLFEDRLLGKLHAFLTAGKAFYEKYGYFGLLQFEIDFFRLENINYIPYGRGDFHFVKIVGTPNSLQYRMSVNDLADGSLIKTTIIDVIRDTAWSFGCESVDEIIKNRYVEL